MRHKYHTRALVIARSSLGEANALLTFLTPDLGLVRARAQSVRKPGAKLASALGTFSESDVILVKGSEGWRVTGATLLTQWHRSLAREARLRAGRIAGLVLRLAPGEAVDRTLFPIFTGFLSALEKDEEVTQDAAECLAALRLLSTLGLDAGAVPGAELSQYEPAILSEVTNNRSQFVARINRGIVASGL